MSIIIAYELSQKAGDHIGESALDAGYRLGLMTAVNTIIRSFQGKSCQCPACGAPAHWDLKSNKVLQDAAWYNLSEKRYECYECWLK